MPWNNGGPDQPSGPPNPWGTPPGDSGRGGDRPRGEQRPGLGRGPWSGAGASPPDIDELIARVQAWLRGMLPPGAGGPRRGGGGSGKRFSGSRGLLLLVAAAVAIWAASGFYRVEPDQQGVVLRFGAYVRSTLPGLNYHLPWPIETAQTPAVTRINRVEVGYRSASEASDQAASDQTPESSATDISQESLMLTGDENIIDINFAVFWRVSNAERYLFNTRAPDHTVKQVAESVMREVLGRTPIQPALTSARAQIEEAVKTGEQAVLDQYGSGIEITQVQLQKVDPPAEVIESFRDVQRANTDAESARNQAEAYRNDIVPRASGDAAAVIATADAQRQAAMAQAGGEAQRFLSVLKAYDAAKQVTLQRLYIETMQDVLAHSPTTVVDDKLRGVVPYLPLPAGAGAGK